MDSLCAKSCSFFDEMTWSPDGKTVLVLMATGVKPHLEGGIWSIRVDGTHRRQLTFPGPSNGRGGLDDHHPKVAPDGMSFVFDRINEATGRHHIEISPIDGGTPAEVTIPHRLNPGDPTWTPDGIEDPLPVATRAHARTCAELLYDPPGRDRAPPDHPLRGCSREVRGSLPSVLLTRRPALLGLRALGQRSVGHRHLHGGGPPDRSGCRRHSSRTTLNGDRSARHHRPGAEPTVAVRSPSDQEWSTRRSLVGLGGWLRLSRRPSIASSAETDFSGVVRVARGEEVLCERASGLADRAHGIPTPATTRFGIASGTKGFTALTIMSLVAEGSLALNTSVRSVLGDALELIDSRVTIGNLLAHASGIGDYLDEDSLEDIDEYEMPGSSRQFASTRDYLLVLRGHPTKFEAGARFEYCNGGFVVLALIAEAVSAKSFQDLAAERVFAPAGMAATGFPPIRRAPRVGGVRGYLPTESGLRTNQLHLPVRGSGDGGAYSTVGDFAAFWPALLEGRIVPRPLVEEMVRPHNDAPEQSLRYGLGFWIPSRPGHADAGGLRRRGLVPVRLRPSLGVHVHGDVEHVGRCLAARRAARRPAARPPSVVAPPCV